MQVSVEVSNESHSPSEQVPALSDPLRGEAGQVPACGLDGRQLGPLLAPGRVVLLSDPLGAEEPLAVVEDVLCLAEVREVPVTLALAFPSSEQAALNTWLGSAGLEVDREALLARPFWRRPWQDGRTSVAMLKLLEFARLRRARGVPLTVLAVDEKSKGNARQAAIAARLLSEHESHPRRLMVAVLGNASTTRKKGTAWNSALVPVGARLAAALPRQVSAFDVAFDEGSHWACVQVGAHRLRCGAWVLRPGLGQTRFGTTRAASVRVFEQPSAHGFDGVYFVGGALTPSPPAVEALRVDDGVLEAETEVPSPLLEGGD